MMENSILDPDGIDRRGFLKCMAWAGTGLLYTLHGGVLKSIPLMDALTGQPDAVKAMKAASFSFVQISDSHIGFSKDANMDVIGTLRQAIDSINRAAKPDLLLHTGDLSHLSKPEEFDALDQVLKSVNTSQRFFVPGEHDVLGDDGAAYLARYGKGSKGHGWYSFDHRGVHFVGLVNVMNLKAGGLGNLGEDQVAWLADDLKGLRASTPVVVFAHIPLWSVYPEWGWGTDDGARALSMLQRFGSVTVLNGHIHQIVQKVEGNITFHTARSTAFPQPAPGSAPSPGPMKVPAGQLASVLGVTHVDYVQGNGSLAIVDSTLAAAPAQSKIAIENFAFMPPTLGVAQGSTVTWTNRDEEPHLIAEKTGRFKSKPLDTGDSFSHVFLEAGTFDYFCTMHPKMQGKLVVG
ncbi:MAG TPA: metallophosphoesterase [Fimbriimonadaceae bacterium]|nr:metallophosphoesterase [Fimbriimonadaceae bacterium]